MPLLFSIGFLEITMVDILDIVLVSYLMFRLYKLLKGSVAVKILLGILFLYVIYILVNTFDLKLLSSILGQFLGVGVIATIILFQQEIRKFLMLIGRSPVFNNEGRLNPFNWRKSSGTGVDVSAVIDAARALSTTQTGALIVFTKSSALRFYAESGDLLDAILSKRMLISIFNKYSPLHDGAVIIDKGGRIKAARCILPVSENEDIPASMGLRHRAAIGLTEITDAIVLVVSEETGQISLTRNGIAYADLAAQELRIKLNKFLSERETRRVEEEEVKDNREDSDVQYETNPSTS
ncbi:MAG: diadenylate cyclase CdaA [Thermonemataceae bacterium]